MKNPRRLLAALLAVPLILTACGSNSSGDADNDSGNSGEATDPADSGDSGDSGTVEASSPAESQGADQSNKLSMYCALPEDECKDYIHAFEEETDIDVQDVRLSAGQILARVQAEKDNPQAAVWYGGSTDNFINAAEKGLLEKYIPSNIDAIPDKYHSSDGTWTPFYIGAIGFAVNTEWLDRNDVEAPTSWADLLKPDFKDNIMMAHPSSSGTAYTVLATLVQLQENDAAFDYLAKLNQNMRQYTTSGAAPGRLAGLGETAVGISFSHDILAARSQGYPLTLTFPEEGTGYEIGAVGMIKGGPDDQQATAQKFIDWVISKDGQDAFAETGWFRIPLNPDAEIPDGAQPVDELDLIDYDDQWAAEHRDELLAQFSDTVATESEAQDIG